MVDFGERLKSVLTSFTFSDVSSNDVNFFTINQWFDETFFNENSLQNLHFPSINFSNLKKFNKKFKKTYNEKPQENFYPSLRCTRTNLLLLVAVMIPNLKYHNCIMKKDLKASMENFLLKITKVNKN